MTAKWFPRPTGYANLSNDVELVLGPKRNWHLSEKVSLGRSSWAWWALCHIFPATCRWQPVSTITRHGSWVYCISNWGARCRWVKPSACPSWSPFSSFAHDEVSTDALVIVLEANKSGMDLERFRQWCLETMAELPQTRHKLPTGAGSARWWLSPKPTIGFWSSWSPWVSSPYCFDPAAVLDFEVLRSSPCSWPFSCCGAAPILLRSCGFKGALEVLRSSPCSWFPSQGDKRKWLVPSSFWGDSSRSNLLCAKANLLCSMSRSTCTKSTPKTTSKASTMSLRSSGFRSPASESGLGSEQAMMSLYSS